MWCCSSHMMHHFVQAANSTVKLYSDVILSMIASQITGISIVCSTVCSRADQRKHQSYASLALVWGNHQWLVDSPHKGPVTQKMFPFDYVIMNRLWPGDTLVIHYNDVIMGTIASQITSLADCLLNRLFRRRSKKTSKLRVTGLCAGNPPVTGEFPSQMASYAENVSIWWRHHDWFN